MTLKTPTIVSEASTRSSYTNVTGVCDTPCGELAMTLQDMSDYALIYVVIIILIVLIITALILQGDNHENH